MIEAHAIVVRLVDKTGAPPYLLARAGGRKAIFTLDDRLGLDRALYNAARDMSERIGDHRALVAAWLPNGDCAFVPLDSEE